VKWAWFPPRAALLRPAQANPVPRRPARHAPRRAAARTTRALRAESTSCARPVPRCARRGSWPGASAGTGRWRCGRQADPAGHPGLDDQAAFERQERSPSRGPPARTPTRARGLRRERSPSGTAVTRCPRQPRPERKQVMTSEPSNTAEGSAAPKRRVVIVGRRFARLFAARTLRRRWARVEVVLVNSTDYSSTCPCPEWRGRAGARRVAVSLAARLPGVRVVLGEVRKGRSGHAGSPSATRRTARGAGYDRLVIAAGGTTSCCDPGWPEHAHGFRESPTLYLRDTSPARSSWPTRATTRRSGRPVHLRWWSRRLHRHRGGRPRRPADRGAAQEPARLRDQRIRWLLLDPGPQRAARSRPRLGRGPTGCPEAGRRVTMKTSIARPPARGVRLPTAGGGHPLAWSGARVRPETLFEAWTCRP